MTLLTSAIKTLNDVIRESSYPTGSSITARALGVEEALGDPSPYKDFALQRGVEKLMDVEIDGHHGQSFTSSPSNWVGTLSDVLTMDPDDDRSRALIIGTVNALSSVLGICGHTVHCKNSEPDSCGSEIADLIEEKLQPDGILGIVGYQPAMLRNASEKLGPRRVRIVDLNPANIGQVRYGVEVWNGDEDMERMADQVDLCLVTGSTLVNDTIDSIVEIYERRDKEIIFFGTTISGTGALLGLNHLCPKSC
jgi:uncharacterized protein (DUF4213/DUF364 family)